MDIRESIKSTLNESNLTNPSKLYTPFTLFAVYFAIYFKADILGRIFLSDDWAVTEKALAELKNPDVIVWFSFAGQVAAYSLGMLVLYGVSQFLAVGIWALSNRINTRINAELHRGKYVATSLLEKAEIKLDEIRSDNRKLYSDLASYHTWKPEDITRLENDLKAQKFESNKILESINVEKGNLENKILEQKNIIQIQEKHKIFFFEYHKCLCSIRSTSRYEDVFEHMQNEDKNELKATYSSIDKANSSSGTWYLSNENSNFAWSVCTLEMFTDAYVRFFYSQNGEIGVDIKFTDSSLEKIKEVCSYLSASPIKEEHP